MKKSIMRGFFLLSLWLMPAYAEEIYDVSLRFHRQWELGETEKETLREKYGPIRVSFDPNGQAVPKGLPSALIVRWKRFYELCMRDGCYYCDADEGSCESGTCGIYNVSCKPYMTSEGLPQCGVQCADYAFISTLP